MLHEAYKDILSRAVVILASDHTFENVDEIHEPFGGAEEFSFVLSQDKLPPDLPDIIGTLSSINQLSLTF
jgi:hypothetical protein